MAGEWSKIFDEDPVRTGMLDGAFIGLLGRFAQIEKRIDTKSDVLYGGHDEREKCRGSSRVMLARNQCVGLGQAFH